MKDRIAKAKKAGYSDSEILEYLSSNSEYRPKVQKALESGYEPSEILSFLGSKEKNKQRKEEYPHGVASYVAKHPKEAAASFATENILRPLEAITSGASPAGVASLISGKGVHTPLSDYASEKSGFNELSDLAKEEGEVLNSLGMLIPFERAAKGASKTLSRASKLSPKKPPSTSVFSKPLEAERGLGSKVLGEFSGEPERMASGLAKPRALEAANPKLGLITKERQEKAISKLDEEAQSLIKSKIKERIPLSKKFEEGFDFRKHYEKEFGDLLKSANEANPQININPVSSFLRDTSMNYRGIPTLHRDAKMVTREIDNFRTRAPSTLKDLLKVRRSNTQKLNEIYERRLLSGKRREYADFLNNLNKKIDESIGQTLPEDSAWFKRYSDLMKEYKDFRSAQDALNFLEPLLREKINTSSLTRLATDPKKQSYLKIKMGEEGAAEVIQIAKDLVSARNAIKNIPVREWSKFDAIWPISWLWKPSGIITTAKRGVDWGRRGYGYLLSSPARRKAFDEALHAVAANDLQAYKEATKSLQDMSQEVKLLEHKT